MWHGLLRTFAGVKYLRLAGALVGDLFRSLQLDEGVLPLDLLPNLRELVRSAPLKVGLPPGWELQYTPSLSTPITPGYCKRCERWFAYDRALEQHIKY